MAGRKTKSGPRSNQRLSQKREEAGIPKRGDIKKNWDGIRMTPKSKKAEECEERLAGATDTQTH